MVQQARGLQNFISDLRNAKSKVRRKQRMNERCERTRRAFIDDHGHLVSTPKRPLPSRDYRFFSKHGMTAQLTEQFGGNVP